MRKILSAMSDKGKASSTILLTLLEFMSLLYRTEEEELLKPKCDENGIQHFPGEVVLATDSSYRRAYETIKPLLRHNDTATVIIVPLPRFLNGLGCCNVTAHVTNRGSEALKEDSFRAKASGKNTLNRLLIADQFYAAKAFSVHPTLRQHLTATVTAEENPDLGNYMPLDKSTGSF